MIITQLFGGLGNQMFQYAAGRNLAYKNKTELKLDISSFETYNLRWYDLGHYRITENFAAKTEIQKFMKKRRKFSRLLKKVVPSRFYIPNHYYRDKRVFHYDPEVFSLKGNIYLAGYWQTEQYFKDIRGILLHEFTVKTEPNEKNTELLDKIEASNAVALHVRRMDYVTDPHTHSVHGVCNVDYYLRCIEKIRQMVDDPQFFVFSDDPQWTRDYVKIDSPTVYISHNGPNQGHEDLRLMRQCNNFIIANSSFSWWGAWLSENPNKVVLAPKQWIRNERVTTKDLIPEGWLTI